MKRSRGLVMGAVLMAACTAGGEVSTGANGSPTPDDAASPVTPPIEGSPSNEIDEVVDIGGGRGLYVRCTGSGSPTVVLEGGDEDDSSSYLFAESTLSESTMTCVYDRANLGMSDPAPGPRGLDDLVGDLEALLSAASIPPPYVLVGTSGGGFIIVGFAVEHPEDVAGMVLIDTPRPLQDPPAEIVEATAWDNPENVEQRDYLQVENDAWDARQRIGDIPVTIVSVKYSKEDAAESPFPAERDGILNNEEYQRGWLVLSPQAEQIVVRTGHAVEEEDPELVIDVITDVVEEARRGS